MSCPDPACVDQVHVVDGELLRLGREPGGLGVVVRDPRVSRSHATLLPGPGAVVVADDGSANGVFVNGQRIAERQLQAGDVIRVGDSTLLVDRGPAAPPDDGEDMGIVGRAESICALRSIIRRVGPSQLPVMVTGATGTGKELVARALHAQSGRRGPFLAVNCAALPGPLVENALFGRKKGAYTDATSDQDGAFVRAGGGTLFLDEIGDLAPEAQPKLLRALDTGEVTPVGATAHVGVDLRIVVATNTALDQAMRDGRFREDLYARLAGVTLRTPPLAERREDILLLLRRFLPEAARARPMSPDFVEAMLTYAWPRNVRELMMLAERLQVLYPDAPRFDLGMLDDDMAAPLRARGAPDDAIDPHKGPPSREELVALLERCRGNVSRVARLVQRNRKQVYRWMDIYGMDRGSGRSVT
jgi:DNA-binding NtrC family response regulator